MQHCNQLLKLNGQVCRIWCHLVMRLQILTKQIPPSLFKVRRRTFTLHQCPHTVNELSIQTCLLHTLLCTMTNQLLPSNNNLVRLFLHWCGGARFP